MGAEPTEPTPPPSPEPTPLNLKSPHLHVPRSPYHHHAHPAPTPAPAPHAFPSTEARLLSAMAPHLWASPKALSELIMHSANNVLDFSHYQKEINGPLPQCMRLTNGRVYMRKVFDVLGALIIDSKFAVVAGSAGVGKSLFLWLDFAQRLTRSEPCAWILHDSIVLIRSARAEVIPFAALGDDDTPGLEDVMLFVDWTLQIEAAGPREHVLKPEILALLEFCKGIIMASGPYEERWRELRERWMPSLSAYVMPPWSFHEIHDGATTLMNFNSPPVVNRLMDRFGTVPHDIFTILAYGPTHGDTLWTTHATAIKRFAGGGQALRKFHDTAGPATFAVLPRTILTIFLSCPCDPSDLTWESSRCLLRSTELNKTVQERATDEFASVQMGGNSSAAPPRAHAHSHHSHSHSHSQVPPSPMLSPHHHRESPRESHTSSSMPLHSSGAQYMHHTPSIHKIPSHRSAESTPLFP